ncbi:MAG: nicotinate phosphoribosyltransferase [Candidatus Competibacterales bacterium]|nr:nicotinate phosphoribosyltransferase [Candidatus Competibacterales bacterium]
MLNDLFRDDTSLGLLTDQYQLTMACGYWKTGMAERRAEFHMFYRKNPFHGGFVIMAGLGTLAEYLRRFRFGPGDLDYLATLTDRAGHRLFAQEFLDYLGGLRFACDIHAVPEGTVVFPNEPLVRVQGPLLQAQILETLLLNTINFQSLVATKAARVCIAAKGDPVIDFGLRRAQGLAGLAAARAAYIGGCSGTSNVLAGKLYDIPVVGTHAHSWIMSFEEEREAFAAYARAMPDNCVFLVDTYGSISGIRNAIEVGHDLRARGHEMIGIRLDSGDLAYFSKQARRMLDEAGFPGAKVMASNELDEYVITSLKLQGARIDAWGVGTKLVTAYDDPALTGVYKLTAIQDGQSEWQYKLKLSDQKSKMSIPGLLQVHRHYHEGGLMMADAIAIEDENPAAIDRIIDPEDNLRRKRLGRSVRHETLLQALYRNGRLQGEPPELTAVRERVQSQLSELDDSHKRFEYPHTYPVGLSPTLNGLRDEMIQQERERLSDNGS